jgi:hypothetical protein
MSAISDQQKAQQAQQQAKVNADMGKVGPMPKADAGNGTLDKATDMLMKGFGKEDDASGNAKDLSTAYQSNGQKSDPLSFSTVKSLNDIGITGKPHSEPDQEPDYDKDEGY